MNNNIKKIINIEEIESKDIEELENIKKELKKYSKKISDNKEYNNLKSSTIETGCMVTALACIVYGSIAIVLSDSETFMFCIEGFAASSLLGVLSEKISIIKDKKLDKELYECDAINSEITNKIYKKKYR